MCNKKSLNISSSAANTRARPAAPGGCGSARSSSSSTGLPARTEANLQPDPGPRQRSGPVVISWRQSTRLPVMYPTSATTRTVRSARAGSSRGPQLLARTEVIASPETQLEYRIGQKIGEGGFGQVYLATRLGRSPTVPEEVCIKVSTRIDAWLREAYFGQLLDGHPRAIPVFDCFPVMLECGMMLYCLLL